MEKKKNKKYFYIFISGLALASGLFIFGKSCLAENSNKIIISEILPNPKGSSEKSNEFVELYNSSSDSIDLADWYLSERSNTFKLSGSLEAGEYKAFYGTVTLYNEKETLKLFNPISELVDEITYPNPTKEDFSYSFIDSDWIWTYPSTPNEENIQENQEGNDQNSDENSPYTDKVKINEIKAFTSDEFIEVVYEGKDTIDFSKWCVKDETQHSREKGICKKPSDIKSENGFYVLYGRFSLNSDSKGDSVFLYDENKKLVDKIKYSGAKSGYYYALDRSSWRWTKIETTGKENQFDKILSGKLKLPDKIYANIYANFSVKAGSGAQKFTWDFGDGHKSYLKDTRHKYKKTGKYDASLKIRGDGEDAFYEFEIEVKKYAAPKIRIATLSPNPKGSDTKNEWIEIKNESKKKINLDGWGIATGSEKLYNHLIRDDFEIKPGKSKKLTRKICAFTLNNSENKIELRDPSGKVVQKIKYDRRKNKIEEDEIYKKDEDGWSWLKKQADTDLTPTGAEKDFTSSLPPVEDIDSSLIGKYSIDPAWQNKKDYKIVLALASTDKKIILPEKILSNQAQVLGAEKVKEIGNAYLFTRPNTQKHWAEKLLENLWIKINFSLNWILNKI